MLKVRMKNFKEDNIDLKKSIIETFNCLTTECPTVDEIAIKVAMKFFVDNISNEKLTEQIQEVLLNCAIKIGSKFIIS